MVKATAVLVPTGVRQSRTTSPAGPLRTGTYRAALASMAPTVSRCAPAGRPAPVRYGTIRGNAAAPPEVAQGQARALLDEHTALTHLGEQGGSLLMLMAKSRHKKPENARR